MVMVPETLPSLALAWEVESNKTRQAARTRINRWNSIDFSEKVRPGDVFPHPLTPLPARQAPDGRIKQDESSPLAPRAVFSTVANLAGGCPRRACSVERVILHYITRTKRRFRPRRACSVERVIRHDRGPPCATVRARSAQSGAPPTRGRRGRPCASLRRRSAESLAPPSKLGGGGGSAFSSAVVQNHPLRRASSAGAVAVPALGCSAESSAPPSKLGRG